MKNLLIVIFGVIAILLGHNGYQWKQVADERGWKAEQAYERVNVLQKELADAHTKDKAMAAHAYLSQVVVTVNGKNLSRADLFDLILAKALQPGK